METYYDLNIWTFYSTRDKKTDCKQIDGRDCSSNVTVAAFLKSVNMTGGEEDF